MPAKSIWITFGAKMTSFLLYSLSYVEPGYVETSRVPAKSISMTFGAKMT